MPLPFSFVVKYRSKIRCRCSGLMPTPVSANVIDDAAAARRLAPDAQRAAVRHRLTGVQRQVQERLAQHRRVAVDVGRAVALDDELRRRSRSASGRTIGTTSSSSGRERDRLQLQILGPRELQEPLDHFVEPPDLAGDDVDVLERLGAIDRRRGVAPTAAARAPRPSRADAGGRGANCCRSSSR